MKISKITFNIVIISIIFSVAALASFSYINHLQQIPLAHAEGDGGDGGDGDAGDGGTGDAGDSGSGDAGVGAIGDAGVGGMGDGGAPGAPDSPGGPGGPGAPGPGPAAPPGGTPPASPPSTPPSTPPSGGGPGGPGGGPFLGVCLDTRATNYGGTLPCLYSPSSPVTLARRITPLSYVYLSQVPYTGIADNAATYAFLITILGISGFISYHFMYGNPRKWLSLIHISAIAQAMPLSLPVFSAAKETRRNTPGPVQENTVALFIKALLQKDHETAHMILRSLERAETSAKDFTVKAIAEIENSFRVKKGEAATAHPAALEATAGYSPEALELLLRHLVSAVHTPLSSHALALEIAILKITEALNALTLTQEV